MNALRAGCVTITRYAEGTQGREIAIGTLGLLIGALQLPRAADDPALSKDILPADAHAAGTLIHPLRGASLS